jgi:hypothetical protein
VDQEQEIVDRCRQRQLVGVEDQRGRAHDQIGEHVGAGVVDLDHLLAGVRDLFLERGAARPPRSDGRPPARLP